MDSSSALDTTARCPSSVSSSCLLIAGAICSALLIGSQTGMASGREAGAAATASRPPTPDRPRVLIPLAFEMNYGQTDPRVKFIARGSGYALFLTSSDAVLAHRSDAVRLMFRGANAGAHLSPLDRLPGVANYLLGQDPAGWRTNVATYAKIRYESLYPGIDLVFYGNDQQLEYDLIVKPGADTRKIRLALDGARELKTAGDGGLVARTRDGEIRLHKPMIYQASTDGQPRRAIDGRYRVIGSHTIAFDVGAHDRRRPLVIDPVVVYSTYLGGSAGEQLRGSRQMIAVDAHGSAYVTGTTDSSDFPTTGSALQPKHIVSYSHDPAGENRLPCFPAVAPNYVGSYAFVAKLSPDGSSLVYGTYLGGTYQIQLVSGIERCGGPTNGGTGIAVDSWGNAYVTGFTDTVDFPGTFGNPSWTMFVTKLDANGSGLVYTKKLESSINGTQSNAIAVGTDGSAYVAGVTYTSTLATPGAFQTECKSCNGSEFGGGPSGDAFVFKLNPAGTGVDYGTLIGGTSVEVGNGIAVDSAGQAYVTGTTTSIDFPTTVGAFRTFAGSDVGIRGGGDVFVTKLSADGSAAVFSTYLNGNATDVPGSIAADAAGNAYVTGYSNSPDFPTTPGVFRGTLPDRPFGSPYDTTAAFVTKFTPGGAVAYSTFLGGAGLNQGVGIAVDSAGRAYVVGGTDALNFPTVDATQPSIGRPYPGAGSTDAFLSVLNPSGSDLAFSTYLGGPMFDFAQGVAVGRDGSAYVVGVTSHCCDPLFPTTPGAFQTLFGGGNIDLFVSRITVGPPPDTTPPVFGAVADLIAEATSADGVIVTFGLPDATDTVDPHPSIVAVPASGGTFPLGTTPVTITATDASTNSSHVTFNVTVVDTTPPTLTVPANITTPTTPSGGAAVIFSATAEDLVDHAPTTSCAPVSGATFPIGTTPVSCTAADDAGNTSASKTFSVIVTPKNPKPPKVKAPKNMKVEAAGPGGASISFTATATDPVYGTVPVTCDPASGSTFPLGVTTVTCSATNDFGKSDADAFIIMVRDSTAPTKP